MDFLLELDVAVDDFVVGVNDFDVTGDGVVLVLLFVVPVILEFVAFVVIGLDVGLEMETVLLGAGVKHNFFK